MSCPGLLYLQQPRTNYVTEFLVASISWVIFLFGCHQCTLGIIMNMRLARQSGVFHACAFHNASFVGYQIPPSRIRFAGIDLHIFKHGDKTFDLVWYRVVPSKAR